MRVLLAADIFPPETGGPATYVVTLANELVKAGIGVTVVTHNQNPTKVILDNRVILSHVYFHNFFLRYVHYFLLLLRHAVNVGVIYAMGPVNAGWPALLVSRLLKKKFIVKVVGDYAWEQATNPSHIPDLPINAIPSLDEFQTLSLGGKIKKLKNIEINVCKNANVVIVPSHYLERIVIGWGIPENKVKVVYNSIDLKLNFGAVSRQDARAKLGFTEEDIVIVSVGRPVSWKGFGKLAIAVARLIKDKQIPIKLRILGVDNSEQLCHLIRLANDRVIIERHPLKTGGEGLILKVDDKHYTLNDVVAGKKPKEKVYEYLLSADIFVLNSGYEGLSHAILEAFTFGVPVITTRVGGNIELVEDKKSALLIDYNDQPQLEAAIELLVQDEELRDRLTKNAKDSLDKFSLPTMVERTKQILEQVCAS